MDLFSPVALGDLKLSNRLVMAPLTRSRSGKDGVPNADVAEYYRQRASLGLIVSEATYSSFAGQGFIRQPGLVTEEQVAGWKKVTDAVHAEGGLIVAQVMHAGRATHTGTTGADHLEAPSAIAVDGQSRTYTGKYDYQVPHALTTEELPRIVEEFVTASRNAIAAGFDGVELHGANGYLLHEFLAPTSNTRTDNYGGSPENRARLVIEVVTAVANAIGAEKTSLRISPEHNIQSVIENDAEDVLATYTALVEGIAPLGLANLSILHRDLAGDLVQSLRKSFGGPVLLNTGFAEITTYEEAARVAAEGWGDAVVVGRPAIANPDLVRRWKEELPLNEPDFATFYTEGPAGYTDYPFWQN
ncbi:alkene reductase [Arthrobacter sp. NIO-1057]|uniref:alkene reductase n=1 Tax=Arthrobacter sp. NIO-1057 TaxID=993071 RepID=UPI00071DB94A|nr:alkene reductase [Arthrobacter sp. NIO-1057]KSU65977.1 1,2-oxophytodienoate reductase [Arthrobacter sp. NIO-1057]SCC28990.1 2,4-dienoyl-CoA reductase [Arthrobacter sp. NIO-1057]